MNPTLATSESDPRPRTETEATDASIGGHLGGGSKPPHAPPRYKVAVVVWLAIYPTVLLAQVLLRPVTRGLPLFLQTLAVTLVVVPLAVWLLIPTLNRLLGRWLQR